MRVSSLLQCKCLIRDRYECAGGERLEPAIPESFGHGSLFFKWPRLHDRADDTHALVDDNIYRQNSLTTAKSADLDESSTFDK